MEREEQSQFSITHWPGTPVPVPPIVAPTLLHFDESVMAFGLPTRYSLQLPPELYLRDAQDLDLSDLQAIRAFVEEFGPMGRPDLQDVTPGPRSAFSWEGSEVPGWISTILDPSPECIAEIRRRSVAEAPEG